MTVVGLRSQDAVSDRLRVRCNIDPDPQSFEIRQTVALDALRLGTVWCWTGLKQPAVAGMGINLGTDCEVGTLLRTAATRARADAGRSHSS